MSPSRKLAVTLLCLLLAALGLWISTRMVWLRAGFTSSLRGPLTATATGAQLNPELGGLALLSLAAVAGVLASSGWVRRLVGVLVAAAGGWVVWLSVRWLGGSAVTWFAAVPAPSADAMPAGPPVRTSAPGLPLAAGLLLIAAGVAVICWASVMPRMGSRYASPGAAAKVPDRDRDWWKALDAGVDPTERSSPADPGPRA